MTACKPAYGLIHYRLENRGCQIRHRRAVIDQRLDVCLGEHSAPRRNRIDDLVISGDLIQSSGVRIQQNRHLVDKSAGTSCTGTVHPLLDGRAVEGNLGIFPAKLDGDIRFRNQRFNRFTAGNNLLLEADPQKFGKSKPAGSGNHRLQFCISHFPVHIVHQFIDLVEDIRHMPLIS